MVPGAFSRLERAVFWGLVSGIMGSLRAEGGWARVFGADWTRVWTDFWVLGMDFGEFGVVFWLFGADLRGLGAD